MSHVGTQTETSDTSVKIYSTIDCVYRATNDALKLPDQCTGYAGVKHKMWVGRVIMAVNRIMSVVGVNAISLYLYLHCILKVKNWTFRRKAKLLWSTHTTAFVNVLLMEGASHAEFLAGSTIFQFLLICTLKTGEVSAKSHYIQCFLASNTNTNVKT